VSDGESVEGKWDKQFFSLLSCVSRHRNKQDGTEAVAFFFFFLPRSDELSRRNCAEREELSQTVQLKAEPSQESRPSRANWSEPGRADWNESSRAGSTRFQIEPAAALTEPKSAMATLEEEARQLLMVKKKRRGRAVGPGGGSR
jgi:hypothetical protein